MPAKPKARRTLTPAPPHTAIEIPVAALQINAAIQPRERLDHDIVKEYAILYREQEDGEPETLPALDVFQIDGAYYVADGFHRLEAALQAQRPTLPCEVFQGTVQDALRHAAVANLQRGLPYTYSDKQRVLERLLTDPEVGHRSDRAIAKMIGYTHVTVGRARQRLTHIADLTTKLSRQPATATTPAAQRQEQVAAMLELPTADTEILAKHHDLKPEIVVNQIAHRMADRKESAEEATQAIGQSLRSQAETWRRSAWWDAKTPRPRETAEERRQRQAEAQREERYRRLLSLIYPFSDYLPFTPTAEEEAEGYEPYTPPMTVAEMVAAVKAKDRADMLERLQDVYTFLDAVKAACQEQWGQWETRTQETAASV